MPSVERKLYLERLIMGLEAAIPENKTRLRYFKPEELEAVYTKKFIAAMEESLLKARQELEQLNKREEGGPPAGPA